jgi:ABC-type bacteriocin/lantibiotic exporter with double-glycine peptidase domain
MNRTGDPDIVDRFPALRKLEPQCGAGQIPFIQQLSAAECGAACLAMVLAYYDKHVPLSEIRDVIGVNRDGVDALSLLKAARSYGLHGRGVKVDLDALRYLEKGTILHWEFSHFVVFDKLRKDGVEVVDPALGRRFVPMKQFGCSFTGVAVTLKPANGFERMADMGRPMWSYAKYLIGQSKLLSRILSMSLVLQLVATVAPILTGMVLDRAIPHGDDHLLSVLGVGVIAVMLFQGLASLVRSHLLLALRTQLDAQMTLGFLEHLVSLPYAFFQQRTQGDLLMRLNSNSITREMLTSTTLSGLLDGALASLYIFVLLVISPLIGVLVLLLGLLQAGLLLLSYRRNRELMSQDLQTQSKAQSYLVQMLAGIETLKASGAEDRAVQQWSNLFVDQLNVSVTRGRLSALVDSLMSALRQTSPLFLLWFGALQVLKGNLTVGTLLALNVLASGFFGPLSTLISSLLQLQLLRSYVQRINDVLKAAPEQDRRRLYRSEHLSGAIELEKVSFSYGPRAATVVRDISVRIAPGQKLAIVGQSGAGKSTVAKLMLGLYKPSSGRILYDGIDLTELDLRSARRQFGIVTQRPELFCATIRENIALKDPNIPMSEVAQAAQLACIQGDISGMPMGYETFLSDSTGSLSGGQRQRLALARALIGQPAVLLLDEATSELDTITESRVHQNLAALRCTRIVIAHRLSTVRDADLILVLADGAIVERGSHSELLAKCGYYWELVRAQMKTETDVPGSGGFQFPNSFERPAAAAR